MSKYTMLFALVFAFGWASVAHAGEREPRTNRASSEQPNPMASAGVATCELGTATADLDINNVRARLYNTGGLFWRGGDPVYEVPKGSGVQAIFASGIWIGGQVDEVLRFAGADYGNWEFWPGPLDDDANAPADCTPFDRFWSVRAAGGTTILELEDETGLVTKEVPVYEGDLDDWPVELGAPFFDFNDDGIYNPADGDLPAVVANEQGRITSDPDEAAFPDQQIWWVMNDKGNAHNWSNAQPIGLEVRAHAFAIASAGAIGNTTFYKYQLVYKSPDVLQNTFLGLWSDPDLGDFNDDYVGSDPVLGLGYVYNGDANDEGGYGTLPPALGYDFFQGPLVDADGVDNDGDGTVDEDGERIAMEKFVYYNNDSSNIGNPTDGEDAFKYLQGIWRDDNLVTSGGNGYNPGSSNPVTNFIWPDDPPNFWSEYNTDGMGSANQPADRRFVMSAGPFTMRPSADGSLVEGENLQNIVFGIQWSRNSSLEASQPQIASQRLLEFENPEVQGAFNANFNVPRPPSPPVLTATGLDGQVVLTWTESENSNNQDGTYSIVSPFAAQGTADDTYDFEGYRILQYDFIGDQNPEEVAVLDVVNGTGVIIDQTIDAATGEVVTEVKVAGGDNGVRNYFVVNNLTNAREYFFAVQSYAFNADSSPLRVFGSPVQLGVNLQSVVPQQEGSFRANVSDLDDSIPFSLQDGPFTTGSADIRIVDPAILTGDQYRVEFFNSQAVPAIASDTLTYQIVNVATMDTVFSALDFFDRTGTYVDYGDPIYFDGIEVTIRPEIGSTEIRGNADGIDNDGDGEIDGDDTGGEAGGGVVELTYGGTARCNEGDEAPTCEVYEGRPVWHTPSASRDYYLTGTGGDISRIDFRQIAQPFDYEIRFSSECENNACWGLYTIFDGFRDEGQAVRVPFELWQVLRDRDTGAYSDVVRLIPVLRANTGTEPGATWNFSASAGGWDGSGLDGGGLVGAEVSDQIFWMYPDRPNGYDLFAGDAEAAGAGNLITSTDTQVDPNPSSEDGDDCRNQGFFIDFCYRNDEVTLSAGLEGFMSPIGLTQIADHAEDNTPPPAGTTIRIYSQKTTIEGNSFLINTAPFKGVTQETESVESALGLIQIVPNPYRGYSEYERGNVDKIARFTNLPDQATIRIFTLGGTLVRTLEKVPGTEPILNWDLNNEAGLPVASGMYLIHIDVPGVGERVLKFGLVQRRLQLDTF